jgi:hypothetical protein
VAELGSLGGIRAILYDKRTNQRETRSDTRHIFIRCFVFLALLLIPLILIGGMISALIALIRRERYSALSIFGLVGSASLLIWVAHRILTSEWHF